MNDFIDRPLKELFAAVYHDHQKHEGSGIRPDQEKVLNELLDQPKDFKNKVRLTQNGLEVWTQTESLYYAHADSVDGRKIKRLPRDANQHF